MITSRTGACTRVLFQPVLERWATVLGPCSRRISPGDTVSEHFPDWWISKVLGWRDACWRHTMRCLHRRPGAHKQVGLQTPSRWEVLALVRRSRCMKRCMVATHRPRNALHRNRSPKAAIVQRTPHPMEAEVGRRHPKTLGVQHSRGVAVAMDHGGSRWTQGTPGEETAGRQMVGGRGSPPGIQTNPKDRRN